MLRNYYLYLLLLVYATINGCGEKQKVEISRNDQLQGIAEEYVRLLFNVGEYDKDLVDFFIGPDSIKSVADREGLSLYDSRSRVAEVLIRLQKVDTTNFNEMLRYRYIYLSRQVQALAARIDILTGTRLTFDDESRLIYNAVSPVYPVSRYMTIIDSLNRLLPPGPGSVAEKYNRFRDQFIIPRERLDTVFKTAIAECRRRTKAHFTGLPENENFEVAYVQNKSWGAYNWFKGNAFSKIEVNTDLPVYIDRAIDLACHEGYPGHHTYHSMLEKLFYRERGWIEFSIYPLFSPQSLISEGLANFGIEMVFPGEERIKFEKEVLFPLAGINPTNADLYYKIIGLVDRLSYAGNEVARRYLDGKINKKEAVKWLVHYQLRSYERAEKYLSFIEQYRSYVINYNLGEDLVRRYIDKKAGSNQAKRWEHYIELFTRPVLPGNLQ